MKKIKIMLIIIMAIFIVLYIRNTYEILHKNKSTNGILYQCEKIENNM